MPQPLNLGIDPVRGMHTQDVSLGKLAVSQGGYRHDCRTVCPDRWVPHFSPLKMLP